jgi:general secretion pathway protein C
LGAAHNTWIVTSVSQALRLDGELPSRLIASAPRWVAGILVVLIGAQLASMLTTRPAPIPPATPAAAAATRQVVDLPSILRASLFGSAAANTDPNAAPTTSLSLVLSGIIADQDPQRGYALVGPSAAAIKVYAVGATLPGGARLHSVLPDRVLLDRGGTIEALLLPRRSSSGPAPPPVAAAPQGGERVQQFMRDNPGVIGEILRPQAVLADGRQRGYRVYPGPNQAAFNRLGLRPGDLVTAINGTTLDDPSKGGDIFGTLSSVAEARVTVIRNGAQQELVLNLADVANEAERMNPQAPPPPNTMPPPQVREGMQ